MNKSIAFLNNSVPLDIRRVGLIGLDAVHRFIDADIGATIEHIRANSEIKGLSLQDPGILIRGHFGPAEDYIGALFAGSVIERDPSQMYLAIYYHRQRGENAAPNLYEMLEKVLHDTEVYIRKISD